MGQGSSSSRSPGVLRTRSAAKAPGGAPAAAAVAAAGGGLQRHLTQPLGKLSAAAAAPLGVELPSALKHVSFSTGASGYTPSQLLDVSVCFAVALPAAGCM